MELLSSSLNSALYSVGFIGVREWGSSDPLEHGLCVLKDPGNLSIEDEVKRP
jgi:hypothetical protein